MHGATRILIYVLVGVAVAGLVAFRLRQVGRARPLKLERLWVAPAAFAAFVAYSFYKQPPQGLDWAVIIAAFVVGGAFGWVRGSSMAIVVDPETHALNVKVSPWGIALLVGLVVVRSGLRYELMGNASALHISVGAITDGSLAFAVGLLIVQRIEMALRGRRLLAAARGVIA